MYYIIVVALVCLTCISSSWRVPGRQIQQSAKVFDRRPTSRTIGTLRSLAMFAFASNSNVNNIGWMKPNPILALRSSMPVSSTGKFLQDDSIWPGSKTKVWEHMNDRLITITPERTIKEAAELLVRKSITGMPVTQNGKLLGVVSRKDLLRVLAQSPTPSENGECDELGGCSSTLVESIMTTDPTTISPHATVVDAARLMYPNGINRLLVVNDDGDLVGIITASDIISIGFCDELSEINYD